PRVLPLVGHGEDAHRIEMAPTSIATVMTGFGRWPARIVAVQPHVDVVEIALLRPEESGEGLTLDVALFLRGLPRMDRVVELVGLGAAVEDELIDVVFRGPRSVARGRQ